MSEVQTFMMTCIMKSASETHVTAARGRQHAAPSDSPTTQPTKGFSGVSILSIRARNLFPFFTFLGNGSRVRAIYASHCQIDPTQVQKRLSH